MNGFEYFFLLILIVLVGMLSYRERQADKRKKELERQLEEKRQALFDFLKKKLDFIKAANGNFEAHLSLKNGYFTNYQLTVWKSQNSELFNELVGKPFEPSNLSYGENILIKKFIDFFTKAESFRKNFNEQFVKEELKIYDSLFDNVEGRKLDIQQRIAIVTDDDNNIIIAGAGSGKTTTIIGKVYYIIDRYKIRPEEILLISFTNKSAATLAERINRYGTEAKTFHKLGKDIIAEVEGKQPSVFDDAQFKPLLTRCFTELIRDAGYLKKIIEFFNDFLKPIKSQFEFHNQGDYIQYIKDRNFTTYKLREVSVNGRETYKREVVKSVEECKIANFLLLNNVNYEYEFPYEYDTATKTHRQYKPDFTITQNDKKVYIEHFGISRAGNVPSWFEGDEMRSPSEKYQDEMKWKREVHASKGTVLIESYSYEMSDGTLFENLTKRLNTAGIVLKSKSPEEIWKIITDVAVDEVKNLVSLFGTFITLMKSNNYLLDDLISKNKQTSERFFKSRNALFVEVLRPIVKWYEDMLNKRREIDFSDMINRASRYIVEGRYAKKISYVVVDEFQDISIGRYQLIKAIKTANPSCRLFCVGDDWQSIYRFGGSDIALFKEFERYFGYTVESRIETTYRFHNPLIDLSSDFILKNPNQTKKELKGISNTKKTEFKICYSLTDNQDDTFTLLEIFDELLAKCNDIEKKEIIILGRYGFDIGRIKNERSIFRIDGAKETISYSRNIGNGESKEITAQFMTVHKAKGLESDIVIVINCNSGKYGFPSEISDDPVLNLLLSEADQFENGEERRLFYVAMTRAREKVFFVTDSACKSKFIAELEVATGEASRKKCPNCKTADIVLRKTGVARNGNAYKFFGCSNYLYGCDYTIMEWVNNQ